MQKPYCYSGVAKTTYLKFVNYLLKILNNLTICDGENNLWYMNYEHNYIKNVKYHKKEEKKLTRACVCDLVCLIVGDRTEQNKQKERPPFDVIFFFK